MDTFELLCYAGTRGKMLFRNPVSVDEMEAHCNNHSHIWCRSNAGDAKQCKVNGKVRRWKRDRERIEVPVKYGLYEYHTFGAADIKDILIPVTSGNAPTLTNTSDTSGLAPVIGG